MALLKQIGCFNKIIRLIVLNIYHGGRYISYDSDPNKNLFLIE